MSRLIAVCKSLIGSVGGKVTVTTSNAILMEDGTAILMEDGTELLMEN